ncbi:response regulator [filamentous cyanobacterium LEGE 11480]|uniref:histidine kinase n=1 Tax=Romeriopsis navalis LEGE 11480 TaxID=2777977 RepID=A0A928VK98_9CYAN|nr:response regulator [Romeriopsis navalis]MBE9029288.1 response regulator [Romeriopsis navalis LEGE 11480]
MQIDSNIRDQAYQFFIQESLEFLQILEEGLLNLQQSHETAEIHAIMRAAHSIKGGAASVGLESIKKIAHQMEDVLRALYKDTVVIDVELEELLLQAYDCLRTPLIQQIQTGENDGEHWLEQSEVVFGQLVEKLGDAMLGESELPTAAELGIDIVQVIFSGDVEEGLTRLESVLADAAHPEIAGELRAQAQVFLGVGELVNLGGFVAIANAVESAIETHPQQARTITALAVADFRAAQKVVLDGDRAQGGSPSAALLQWANAAPGEVPDADAPATNVADVFAALAADALPEIAAGELADSPDSDLAASGDFWSAAAVDEGDTDFDVLETVDFAFGEHDRAESLPAPSDLPDDAALPPANRIDLSTDLSDVDFDADRDALSAAEFDIRDTPDALAATEALSNLDFGALEFDTDSFGEFDLGADLLAEQCDADVMADTPVPLIDPVDPTADLADAPPLDTSARQMLQAETVVESWDLVEAPNASPTNEPNLNRDSPSIESIDAVEALNEGSDLDAELGDLVPDAADPQADFTTDMPSAMPADNALTGLNAMMADMTGEDDAWPDVFALTETAEIPAPAAAVPELPAAVPVVPDRQAAVAAVENAETVSVALRNAPPAPAKPQSAKAAKAVAGDTPVLSNAIRVDLERLDRLNNLVGEMVSQENSSILQNQQLVEILSTVLQRVGRFDHLTRELRGYVDGSQTMHSQLEQSVRAAGVANAEMISEFDPLQMDNYSDLSVLMQETIDEIAQIGEAMRDMTLLTRNAQKTQRHKQQTLREVRSDLLWARMLPIGDILQRFPRMIRDMARKHGKSVALHLSGNTTLVDKGMLERLYDPLVHLVRNGFDHGIETIEQRITLGKPEEASIAIRAYHRGSQIYIEIADDGRGIDTDRVLQKALSKQLITPAVAASMTTEEIYDLLFTPGFSTVDIVSELSGRGVGLDTVRTQIKLLKGNLSVTSEPGQGTTFTLRLPLTLTITKLLVFSVDDHLMSVPVDSLLAIVAAPVDQIQTLKNGQFYHWQEQFIPIYPQSIFADRYILSHQSQEQPNALTLPTKGKVPLLMLAGENQTIALPVDTILYERELAIKPFGKTVTPPPYLYGCTLLGDGSLVPVLDAQMLISSKQAEIVAQRVNFAPPKPVVDIRNATILVIDDSLTTRQTLAAVLQKAGYRVLQAKDGRDGVEQLAQHPEIQAVFCDIEMPRMNGFEFLNSCRQDYDKTLLPVTMLSSRSNEKHRQVAKYMGANEYLTKPFLEPELLEVLTTLLQERAAAITSERELVPPVLA